MDEPFSAVDPVVREQLQEEFLRIQKEVSKTIIMVTHDIDEAMKLGDLVAVLKPGGKLAQMASPGKLLNTPQNAFVADFIGKDRGYRKLSFHSANTGTALRTSPMPSWTVPSSRPKRWPSTAGCWLPKTAKRLAGSTPISRQQRLPTTTSIWGRRSTSRGARCAICWTLR